MMDNLKVIAKCIGIALLALIVVNFIIFGFELKYTRSLGDDWSFKFKHGAFYIDGVTRGMLFGTTKATIFLLVTFSYTLYRNYMLGLFRIN